MLNDSTAWLELLPPDTLRTVLSLLSAEDLSSVGATSSAMSTAARSDALWKTHALQMPRWQRCGNPLPGQADDSWPSFHAFYRASRSRCTLCAPDAAVEPAVEPDYCWPAQGGGAAAAPTPSSSAAAPPDAGAVAGAVAAAAAVMGPPPGFAPAAAIV